MNCPICGEEVEKYDHTLYDPVRGTFHAECYYEHYLPKPNRMPEYVFYFILLCLIVRILISFIAV